MKPFYTEQCGIRKAIYIFGKRVVSWKNEKIDAYDYAKSLGVKLGKNVRFITLPYSKFPYSWPTFASEPFMIEIGDNSIISFNCTFITHDGSIHILRQYIEENKRKDVLTIGKIKIGKNCFIGCNTTILPRVKIGDNCIVGACSVVTKDIPDGEVWAGCPAKFVRKTSELAQKYVELNETELMKETKSYYSDNLHWIVSSSGRIKF